MSEEMQAMNAKDEVIQSEGMSAASEASASEPVVETAQPQEAVGAEAPSASAESSGEGFAAFGLCPELMQGIAAAEFTEPTPIQKIAIPEALQGKDLLGQALTGTGKTAAFGLPSMERIRNMEGLQMLVLTPTRELAAQVSSELFRLGQFTGLKTAAFTGGQSYRRQEELLRRGVNILAATPGRLIDLLETKHFEGVNPAIIVVDEADEMLDMGFIDDVEEIFEHFPGPHQTMLFSATMPKQVERLARNILKDPVKLETDYPEAANNEIEQSYFVIQENERTNAVIRLIETEEVGKAIIFCRTREEADSLNILLGGRGYNVNCLHGDMEQAQRSRVMAAFRRGDFDILVATDVAARGLDIEDVTHVFNYHLPFDSRAYVHRIGRTGRAGKAGKAITLVTPHELRALSAIRRNVGAKISLGEIPTRSEVNAQRLEKLLGLLFSSELDAQLYNTICEMTAKQDQDPAVLFTKMVSKHLAATADQGPENIGLSAERVEELMHPKRRERRDRGERKDRGDRRDRRERRERDFEDRPPRRERDFEDRPPRRDWEDRPPRRERDFEDRPPRRDWEDRPPRRERDFEDRPRRREWEDRPPRREWEDRPPRRERDFDDRPRRREWEDRPPRRERDFDDRPRRFDHGDGYAPSRSRSGDWEDRPPRPARPPKAPKAPQPPQPQFNEDGTPKLNRKQRRLLKFGPPRSDNDNA